MTLENADRKPETSRDKCIAQNVERCIQAFGGRNKIKGLAGQGSRELAGRHRYDLYHSDSGIRLFPAHSASNDACPS
ncbi:hypothetical protein CY34DRAFT_805362 [Suillus luteus UH-Slu-Lm8-n1]|uniref:Uncharacterized protein n=1 Tax=Suillus luteus UH-Slu-Lm8-n1 TaxID=930992 RepID=A0A0D0AW54_9AGAM|nr:hypothetical protein CY34DRAFT_805362 [Suillus luteus UH-Slu-Lm8-n1]